MRPQADWQRLQAEFLDNWLQCASLWRELPHEATWALWEKFSSEVAGTTPWTSFGLFAQLLSAYGEPSARGRRRNATITPALQTLLKRFIQGIDAALLAAVAAGEVPAVPRWPAFGVTREWQNAYATLVAAQRAERLAALALELAQWAALRAGVVAFSASLEREDDGPPIASLRGLYDAFIDHLETAYLAQARLPSYAQTFGEYLNASLGLRATLQAWAQRTAPLLGIPTLAEFVLLGQRVAALEAVSRVQPVVVATGPRPRSPPGVAGARRQPKVASVPPPVISSKKPRQPRGKSDGKAGL